MTIVQSAPSAPRAATPRPAGRTLVVGISLAWMVTIGAEMVGGAGAFGHDRLLGDSRLPGPVAAVLFLGAWQVMVAAMMLPSTVPMVRVFEVVSAGQVRPGRAVAAFVGGYTAVWTAFGSAAFAVDTALHDMIGRVPFLANRPWLLTAAVLGMAGAFQFSDLKDRCLRTCRHPAAFLIPRYRRGVLAAFRLGRDHGLFCLGCCWALMLMAFAVGVANLTWTAALTALMAYEKIGRHGHRLVRPVGWALLGSALVVAAGPEFLS